MNEVAWGGGGGNERMGGEGGGAWVHSLCHVAMGTLSG